MLGEGKKKEKRETEEGKVAAPAISGFCVFYFHIYYVELRTCVSVCASRLKLCKRVTMSKLNLCTLTHTHTYKPRARSGSKTREYGRFSSGWERKTDHDKLAHILQNAALNAPQLAVPASLASGVTLIAAASHL